jgi:serine/threonine-protein kinase
MAEVYLAVLRGAAGFERRVALKKILPVYAGMEEFAKLFRDEARIWAALNHSGIVQVYDFGANQGDHWIAMEFVDGPDLEEVLDRCRRRGIHPPVDVVIHLGHRLASALEYAHGVAEPNGELLHLIHRDVSPPNILLSVQGDVKLTDFGVAKATVRDSATRPGVLRGKYAYMSPEQVQHKPIDHRSDLFGLGILLYETLTGVNPFEGSTDYQTIESVGRAEVEPAGFLRPDTPAELDRILLGLLEPDPELRYQSGGELRRDLAALMIDRPQADEPSTLVEFLRELFPERTPQAQAGRRSTPGAPIWEPLAHVLTAFDVDVPDRFPEGPGAGVRLEERPPLLDSLWVSAPMSGDSWGAIPSEDTVSGAPDSDVRLAPPPAKPSSLGSDWDDVSRNEWSVEGEDPEEALQPTQPLAVVPLLLTPDHATLPPLPWADDPVDEATSEFDSVDADIGLEDTDPGLAAISVDLVEPPPRPPKDPSSNKWEIVQEWAASAEPTAPEAQPQPQASAEPSEWDTEARQPVPKTPTGRPDLPVPEAPPPVDALLDHVTVEAPRTDLGLPHLNEWDLGESAFDRPAPPDEDPPDDDPSPPAPSTPTPGKTVRSKTFTPPPAKAPGSAESQSAATPGKTIKTQTLKVNEPVEAAPPPAADLPEPERIALMPTVSARAPKLPEGPIKPTLVSEIGRPAVARAVGGDSFRRLGIRPGHRRRGRGRTSDDDAPLRPRPTDVDLGISGDLPDVPPEEAEEERRALEAARGRPLSRPVLALAAAFLFLLPIGLLLGARRLERIQRDREIPLIALRPEVDPAARVAFDSLPLLQPMAPLRAPEPL